MYDKLKLMENQGNPLKKFDHVTLDPCFLKDCKMWTIFLENASMQQLCRPFIDLDDCRYVDTLNFYTDSSLSRNHGGLGGIFMNRWIVAKWELELLDESPSIEYLELYAIFAALATWGSHELLKNTRVEIYCDNETIQNWINNMTGSCPQSMKLIHMIALDCIRFNRRLFVLHVKSTESTLADALSRMNFQKFWWYAPPDILPWPDKIPEIAWPATKLWFNDDLWWNKINLSETKQRRWQVAAKGSSRSSNFKDSESSSSSISTAALQQIVNKLKNQPNRQSTDKVYYQIWKQFNEFFIKLDKKPKTWEERIVLFVGYLIERNRKSNTIKSYISAIRSVLKKDGAELSENKFLLTLLTKACQLKNDRVYTRLPIRCSLMHLLLKALDKIFDSPQPYLTCLYKAMISTAYYRLFRIGEVTDSQLVVKAADVHIGENKDKMMFVLHTSKMHGRGHKPQIIKISTRKRDAACSQRSSNTSKTGKDKHLCPFQLLRNYVKIRKKFINRHEPFFILRDRTPVSATLFRGILKKLLIFQGLNPSLYRGRSLRGGCTIDMAELQISLELIRKIGRWKSSVIFTYLRT